jgi:antirestriction protein ArdC
MQTATTQSDLFTSCTARIVESIKRGNVPWLTPWGNFGPPMNAQTRRAFSPTNVWLLLTLGYQEHLFLHAEDLESVGATVKPLEHAIVLPQEPKQWASGKNRLTVFNLEQLANVPEKLQKKRDVRHPDPLDACASIVADIPNRPTICTEGSSSTYSLGDDEITILSPDHFRNTEEYYFTLFRLLAYSTGHPKRIARITVHDLAYHHEDLFCFEALVADMVAGYLSALLDIAEQLPYPTPEYCEGWESRFSHDKFLFARASYEAEMAIDHLLRREETIRIIIVGA